MLTTPTVVTQAPESPTIDMSNQSAEVTDGEWTYDPNEPRYCLCNQVSYGDMVACDNVDVRLESFYCAIYCFSVVLVPIGMVSLSLCWYNSAAKREMVLSTVYCFYASTGRKKELECSVFKQKQF